MISAQEEVCRTVEQGVLSSRGLEGFHSVSQIEILHLAPFFTAVTPMPKPNILEPEPPMPNQRRRLKNRSIHSSVCPTSRKGNLPRICSWRKAGGASGVGEYSSHTTVPQLSREDATVQQAPRVGETVRTRPPEAGARSPVVETTCCCCNVLRRRWWRSCHGGILGAETGRETQ
ncbi:hypothetical protein BRADI_1g45905v3 [Brachypodium distachyon]|uniref:Uncharacterized protein n=1 Tax=Brachypodium distachyon TaxID=15368 RepID=A0A2K2DPL7_BRADI|nr:hypothetical protein BRADI_1g45905v3 [Brachypodium distachyon]